MVHWYLQPIFESYLLVAAMAGGLTVLAWWNTRSAGLSGSRIGWLRALRLSALVLLVLALLRPTRVMTRDEPPHRVVPVLLDQSRSMRTPDADNRSRWEAQREMLRAAWPQLAQADDRFEVRFYRFDQQAAPAEGNRPADIMAGQPDGHQTDLGSSLDDVVQHEFGNQVAAIILASDGAQRVVQPRVELLSAARQLARMGIPLYAVPFGQAADPAQARDVAIVNLPDQYRVFVKNQWTLAGTLEIQGYVNQQIPVEAVIEGEDGSRESLGRVQVMATPERSQARFEFQHTPQRPGQYKVTVSVPPQTGETVVDNNQLSSFLTVLEGGIRVLYLESSWNYFEQKFLRRAIDEAPAFELDEVLIDWRNQDQWPQPLPPGVKLADYDVVLLGDVDASALHPLGTADDDSVLAQLAQRVSQGAGLLMIGGRHAFGPGGYGLTPLADVMPIVTNRLQRQPSEPDAPLPEDLHLTGPVVMLPKGDHFVTRLAPGPKNLEMWKQLPPLEGANRLGRLKPAAITLAETPSGEPLLVAGQYGLGRVLAMAGDSTYRWWRYGFAEQHQRFWRQAVLWLANKEDLQQNQLIVRMPQRRVLAGSQLQFEVELHDAHGQPVQDARIEVEVQGAEGAAPEVLLVQDAHGWRGTVRGIDMPGDYRLVARSQAQGQTLVSEAAFIVFQQDLELADPAASPAQLRRLTEMTAAAGGRLIAPEELGTLLEQLRNSQTSQQLTIQTRWQLGDTLIDSAAFLLAFAALVCSDWYLRKRWGLV